MDSLTWPNRAKRMTTKGRVVDGYIYVLGIPREDCRSR